MDTLERFGTQGFREFQRIGHVQRDHRILHVFITGRLAAHRKVGPRRRNDLFGETSYDLRAQPCACVGRRLADRLGKLLIRHQSFGLSGKPGENRIGRIERGPFQIDRGQAPIGPIRTGLAA